MGLDASEFAEVAGSPGADLPEQTVLAEALVDWLASDPTGSAIRTWRSV